MKNNHYRHLLIMAALSFASMYVLMYAMVDSFGNVYANFNQVYMAGLMTAPMVVIELLVMRGMYHDARRNGGDHRCQHRGRHRVLYADPIANRNL